MAGSTHRTTSSPTTLNRVEPNNFDLDGQFCLTGKNENGSCRGSGTVKKVAKKVGRVAKATGRWVNKNRWQLGAIGVGLACTTGVLCGSASALYLGLKTRSTIRAGGSLGDHAWNVGSTAMLAIPGLAAGRFAAGAGTAGYSTAQVIATRAAGESPGFMCALGARCAGPGYPGN